MSEQQQSKIVLGSTSVEQGAPPLAPRKTGAVGQKGSKYDGILEQVKALEKGQGYVRVPLNGTEPERALTALRTVIKRKLNDPAIKVRKLEGGDLGIFRD